MSVAEQERPEQFWRDATAADVVDVMNGKEVEARFRDMDREDWTRRALTGWSCGGESDSHVWASAGLVHYRHCQVYSPPQYWLDKPEPGEGFRLLGKEPDEAKHRDDEIFREGRWDSVGLDDGKQRKEFWYRRRIEPKPEPKFKVGQRVKIIGPKKQHSLNWCSELDQYRLLVAVVTKAEEADLQVAGKAWFYTVEGVIPWRFREDYLEPVVEPAQAKPSVLYPKIGDVIFLPEVGRLRVTARGFEIS